MNSGFTIMLCFQEIKLENQYIALNTPNILIIFLYYVEI
jgi:hypothetical protein